MNLTYLPILSALRFNWALALAVFFFLGSAGKAGAWVNAGFETGDLTGWTATLNSPYTSTVPFAGAVGSGAAPNTNGALNMIHGGNWAGEIYSGNGSGDPNRDFARLEQSDTIPASAPFLSFWFAAALDGAHYLANSPYGSDSYVLVEVIVGPTVVYSQRFSWYDNAPQLINDGVYEWKHLPWTQYYYDLTPYVGQTVTIRYTAYECGYGGHNCYGFIDDAQWLNASQVPTYTPTPSSTPTVTPTSTITFTPTQTATFTPTYTPTPTPSYTPTMTPSVTPTFTPTSTATVTPTFTPSCVSQVWPDPFNPKYAKDHVLKIGCLTPGSTVTIYTLSGEKVWSTGQSAFLYGVPYTATWDGRNQNGVPVSPGVYFYVIQDGAQVTQRGKFLVMGSP